VLPPVRGRKASGAPTTPQTRHAGGGRALHPHPEDAVAVTTGRAVHTHHVVVHSTQGDDDFAEPSSLGDLSFPSFTGTPSPFPLSPAAAAGRVPTGAPGSPLAPLPSGGGGGGGGGASEEVFPVSPWRWYILALFSLLCSNQNFVWLTFSPLSKSAQTYYDISEAQVDLLLNYGPICFLPAVVLVAHMSSSNRGMRNLLRAAGWMTFMACVLRLIPELPYPWGAPTDGH